MFTSWRIYARVRSNRNGEELAKEWMCMGRNLLPLMTWLEMRNSLRSSDPLGKNLLLPSWVMKDFKEESSASLLGIFTWDSLGKNLLLLYWGYFGEESSASLLGIRIGVLQSIREESSASSISVMLDMLELLRKSLLLPLMRIILNTFRKNLLLPSLGILCLRCLKCWGIAFYFLIEDDVWHAWPVGGWFLRCLNHWEWFLMGLIH